MPSFELLCPICQAKGITKGVKSRYELTGLECTHRGTYYLLVCTKCMDINVRDTISGQAKWSEPDYGQKS